MKKLGEVDVIMKDLTPKMMKDLTPKMKDLTPKMVTPKMGRLHSTHDHQ